MPLGALLIGITLWAWGQPLLSTSGEVTIWVNSIWSNENSQQIADWYTLSHILHGMLVAVIGRALGRWIGYPVVIAVAIATGVAWEIGEHTDWVLNRFRGQTIYQGYVGDSVLNAVCDYVFMLAGFALASVIPMRWALGVMLSLEVGSAVLARDSLILSTVRVIHPIQAISDWQDETNPVTHPAAP
jgi:Protein of unknown function (DUF2585)